MSIDFALGMLAKGVETTREAPETIGTALKTVIARMRELTDLGKTFEDGMNVNRVETALRQVGVQLMDTNGQFRDMQAVLTDVGNAWETLNTNQRASVAVALAGTRQQSRLIAIMNDFDRTLELVDIAQYSQGATMAQHMEYMKSMEAATVNLQNAWQKFITTITNSETIIGVVKLITKTIDGFSNILKKTGIIGRNLFTIIVSIVLIFKSWIPIKKVLIALGWIENKQAQQKVALTIKEMIASVALNKTKMKELIRTQYELLLSKKLILVKGGLIKSTLAYIKVLVAQAVAFALAYGPIILAIGAVVGLTAAIYLAITAQDRRIKKIKRRTCRTSKECLWNQ